LLDCLLPADDVDVDAPECAANALGPRPANVKAVRSVRRSMRPGAMPIWYVTPARRNRTSAATNARNRSTKSGFMGRTASEAPLFLAEAPDLKDALARRKLHPELEIAAVSVGGGRVAAYGDWPAARRVL